MVRKFILALGAFFVLIGILGFIPAATPNDQLLGTFTASTVLSVVYLLSGAVLLAAALGGYAQVAAQAFGIAYGTVATLGFAGGADAEIFGFLHVNTADNFLHLAIALSALYAGFTPETRRTSA
ncbi:MAG: DUF4383 domain-containing protein [Patescibacteria group bacterium]